MEISKLAKSVSKYLLLLAVMIVIIGAVFVAKDVHQALLDSKVKTSTRLSIEQISPEWSAGFADACISPYIYTSLPAKCRTAEGKFVAISGLPSNVSPIPELK